MQKSLIPDTNRLLLDLNRALFEGDPDQAAEKFMEYLAAKGMVVSARTIEKLSNLS